MSRNTDRARGRQAPRQRPQPAEAPAGISPDNGGAAFFDAEISAQFTETLPVGSKNAGALPSPDALAPWGPSGPPEPGEWATDVLGEDYQVRILDLGEDEEGPVVAGLVRRAPAVGFRARRLEKKRKFAVLYLHGRNDYFFQTELADRMFQMGGAFYALDLRKYGRALRPWQTAGYTDDLAVYNEEIGEAVSIIRAAHPGLPLVMMGHSTGGLIGTLWAWRHQSLVDGLILNSAWLELQSLTALRPALQKVLARLAQIRPRATVVGKAKNDVYHRAMMGGWAASGFELPQSLAGLEDDPSVKGWTVFEEWKERGGYPAPAAWLQTILEGHALIAGNVQLDIPVLSMASDRSGSEEEWVPGVFSSDVVLNADLLTERAAGLGKNVVIARFPGRHDLVQSDPAVRADVYATIGRWLTYAQLTT